MAWKIPTGYRTVEQRDLIAEAILVMAINEGGTWRNIRLADPPLRRAADIDEDEAMEVVFSLINGGGLANPQAIPLGEFLNPPKGDAFLVKIA